MTNNREETPLINSERLEDLISLYKFPLIFGVLGIILLIISLSLLYKNQTGSKEIIFTSSEASASSSRKIIVDVRGAVMAPGTYEFKEGDRINDALVESGGLSASADRDWVNKNLNRAAKLVDGGKIYIPSTLETVEGKTPASAKAMAGKQNLGNLNNLGDVIGITTGKININTATQKELEDLSGVGPVTAGKIISGRPYQTIEEMKTKKAVGNALFEKIKEKITI